MVTKGIIKSIDLLGNTCTVHIPFFETAGNDPIIETATVSNTPGSYNGYKVGDAVYVAFEDGNMSTPVVIGKLYLGTEKEKADPRGVSNVEESTASKKATLPADASLAADIDKTVPNTTVPYSSLSSIANGLNKLNTDVAQNDRDYGNRFKQVSTAIDEQGTKFSTEINQTNEKIDLTAKELKEDLEGQLEETKAEFQIKSDEISAEVLHKVDSKTNGLGWDLSTNDWIIYAKDSVDVDVNGDGKVDENDVKEFPLFKITRSGVEVSGDLKLSGYSKDTIITYTQTNNNTEKPEGDGYTWTPEAPAWEDGKYIWQKTSVIKWEYNKDTQKWEYTVASEKIVCLSGASAVSYWLNCSTKTHLGQQQDKVDVIAMLKVGTDLEREDTNATLFYKYAGDPETAWTEIKTEIPDDENGSKIITHKFTLSTLQDKSLEIKAIRNGKEYARETIVFSPVNTPVLVFSKDIGKLEYDSYGVEKINKEELATVSATVYLNNKEVPFITWEWTPHNCTVQDAASLDTNSISVTEIGADFDSGEVDCVATYQDQLGKDQPLTKTFTVLKNKQGKAVYKIDISNSPVSVPATETGELSTETKQELPALTLHSLTCYYGDVVLPVDAYWEAGDSAHWNSISDKKFRIKYSAVNVTPKIAVGEVPQNFAIQQLYTNTGSILYELYRGTEKVATNKFEVTMQLQGISATSYGVEYSALVHRGTNQQEAIIAAAWKKFGTDAKTQNNEAALRYSWRQSDGTFGSYSDTALGRIEIPVSAFLDADLKIEIGTLVSDIFTPTGESNIITYSPINTPVLDLSNDNAALTYDNTGNKIGNNTVSCTAAVYLDGKILSTGVSYSWSPANAGEATLLYDGEKLIGSQIVVSNLTTDVVEITCTATVSDSSLFKETITLTKTFTVSKQLQGTSGISIISQTTYYALIHPSHAKGSIAKPESDDDLQVKTKTNPPDNILAIGEQTDGTLGPWSPTPPEHTDLTMQNRWKYWSTVRTQYSNSTKGKYSDPIIDEALSGVYELAQGKTTNYYSELEPTRNASAGEGFVHKPNLKEDDCWFDTINKTLKQCVGFHDSGNAKWEDIGGELVTNKVTATYINALDITAKKVNVPDLFIADGSSTDSRNHKVEIAGFNVKQNTLTTGTESAGNLIKLNSDSTVQYEFEEVTLADLEGDTSVNPPIVIKPFKRAETLWTSTQAGNKAHLTYYVSNSNFEGNPNGYGVTKIIFKKAINNLKFFIKTTSVFTDKDFVVVSTLNASQATSKPVGESEYSYADTYLKNQGDVVDVVAVEFPRVEEDDYIYVTYSALSGQSSSNYGGYIYLPVDTRITVGDHFKVLADGTVYANNLSLGGIIQEEAETSLFGNAGQFTAARVEVIDKTDPLNYKTLLKADGREKDEYGNDIAARDRVQVGGFTVTGNTLTAGHEDAGNNIILNSELYYQVQNVSQKEFKDLLDNTALNTYNNDSYTYKYSNNPIREFRANPSPVETVDKGEELKQLEYISLEYASTNTGVHASFSVAKIVFTQDLPNFDLYLYSGPVSGSTHEDYMWASVLNPSNNSCDFGLNRTNNTLDTRGCKGLTRGKADTIQKVTYENIKKGNYIYIAYIKGRSTNNEPTSGNDIGYFYMPLNVQSSRLKIGENFEVMSDGTTYASNLYLKRNSNATVAGELAAISANLNKLTITEQNDANKILFKADGTNTNNDEKVQIGGFKVTSNKLFAGSGPDYVEFGTDAIKLGGDDSDNGNAAPFSVTKGGYLTAESGKIGGFDLSATSITSSSGAVGLDSSTAEGAHAFWAGDTDAEDAPFSVTNAGTLTATSAKIKGYIEADGGKLGKFQFLNDGLESPSIKINPTKIYFPQSAVFNLEDKVNIYSDATTSYIITSGEDRDFVIKNTSGAGIKFYKNPTDQSSTIVITIKNVTLKAVDRGSYGMTNWQVDMSFDYEISAPLTVTYTAEFTVKFYQPWTTFEKDASYTFSHLDGTYGSKTFTLYSDGGSGTPEFKGIKGGNNPSYTTGAITFNAQRISATNNVLYSLGSFCPNTTSTDVNTGLYLGDTNHRWNSLVSYTSNITTSDRNQKHDIKDLTPDHDGFFDDLRPVSFVYNESDSGRTHLGYIAQEVEESLIKNNIETKNFAGICIDKNASNSGSVYALRYEEFIPLNTDQIQKLKKRVADQEARITELEEVIKKLKTE